MTKGATQHSGQWSQISIRHITRACMLSYIDRSQNRQLDMERSSYVRTFMEDQLGSLLIIILLSK